MANNSLLSVGLVALILVSVGSYFILNNSQGSEEKISTIRIGTTAPGHPKYIFIEQKGWLEEEFKKDGIKIEFYPFMGGGQEAMIALTSGSLEFVYTGVNPSLRTASAGADVQLIALSRFSPDPIGPTVIVREDSKIKSVIDLKGKKVAYLKGTGSHGNIVKLLRTEGLTTNDIDSLHLALEASIPALIRGDIDAVTSDESTIEKFVSSGIAEKGGLRIVKSEKDIKWWTSPSAIQVRGDFARKHPDIVKRFLKIDLKAAEWGEANPDEAIKIFADATQSTDKAVRLKYYADNTSFYIYPKLTNESILAFKEHEEFMNETGLLEGKVDYNSWVDKSYQDSVFLELNKK